ncbi:MAG: MBOAT family protein [Flavobacterium sp.]|nr:MAG: MBOAT family protein [Flavobacterium sp.]
MLFNSLSFAIFLPIVFALYWLIPRQKVTFQNILLLVASYYFYACWDYRFLFLLMFSTLLDYFSGIMMEQATSTRVKKIWFWTSIIINLGFLGVFKYYNFFAESFADFLSVLGFQVNVSTLSVILPVGISFYTFHGLSYVIDIYYDRIKAERNFVDYSVFVSFFPLLVAGPIERATHLLPQIQRQRSFDYRKAVDGMRQILWGLFKKIVIADNCAEFANEIFNNSSDHSGTTLMLGALLFTFQIYCDFSGYSDIALGVARLFGVELLRNFAFPYFSRDIAEFWRRWHISLTTWFRDYLYIPLGGSKGGTWMKVRNTFIIFLVSGFWHGANWTFIVWGLLNAIYFLPLLLLNKNRNNIEIAGQNRLFPTFGELRGIIITFALTALAWIFFRAENIGHAVSYITNMFSKFTLDAPTILPWFLIILIAIFVAIEWIGRHGKFALSHIDSILRLKPLRWAFYIAVIFAIFAYGGSEQEFIYFQF